MSVAGGKGQREDGGNEPGRRSRPGDARGLANALRSVPVSDSSRSLLCLGISQIGIVHGEVVPWSRPGTVRRAPADGPAVCVATSPTFTDIRVRAARFHELNYCLPKKAPEVGVIQEGTRTQCVDLRLRQADLDQFNDLVAMQDPFQGFLGGSGEVLQGLGPRVSTSPVRSFFRWLCDRPARDPNLYTDIPASTVTERSRNSQSGYEPR